jgi:hypothetical protein
MDNIKENPSKNLNNYPAVIPSLCQPSKIGIDAKFMGKWNSLVI